MEYKLLDFSLVVLGNMPPTLITPTWLSKHKLISESEGENADIKIISPQFTSYQISDWGRFSIRPDKLVIGTFSESHHEVIRDIVLTILKLFEGIDIRNVGINHNFHFSLDEEQYIEIGNTLAPFSKWSGILDEPRMLNLEMIQNKRIDGFNGRYGIKIQPSNQLENLGASFNFNDHFNRTGEMEQSTQEMSDVINESWESCTKNAHKHFSTFINNVGL